MSQLMREDRAEGTCPKQPWIMSTLADDEQSTAVGEFSYAMRFHLARCESCRALADRLLDAAGALRDLGKADPPPDLFERAGRQAMAAIEAGAELTGRVDVPDVEELDEIPTVPRWWWRPVRYAVAATILLAFASYWVARFTPVGAPGLTGPEDWDGRSLVTAPEYRQRRSAGRPTAPSIDESGLDERMAGVSPDGESPRLTTVCRHRSNLERAMCDNENCVRKALILSNRQRRRPAWRQRIGPTDDDQSETRLLGNK